MAKVDTTADNFGCEQNSAQNNEEVTRVILLGMTADNFGCEQNTAQNNEEVTRVILLGVTGGGKSSLGNTLLNYKQFIAKASPTSVTENCQVGYRNFNNRHLGQLLIHPVFFDNNGDDERTTCIKIGQSLQTTVPGPHAFLIVLPFVRVTDEVKKGWEWINNIFGEHALNYCIIVFTRLDDLNEDGLTDKDFLENKIPALAKLMEKCGDRYVAFNNRASLDEKNDKIQELLNLIDRVIHNNGNQVFTNKEIKAISKVVDEEVKKGTFVSYRPDGNIILLPQTEKIVVEGYMRKPAVRRDGQQRSTNNHCMTSIKESSSSSSTSDMHSQDNKFTDWKEPHRLSSEKVDIQSAPVFNSDLIGLSLQPYTHDVASPVKNNTDTLPVCLKPILKNVSDILIACLGIQSPLIPSDPPYLTKPFDDECICLTTLLSMTDKYVYFVVSSSVGEYIIPLINQHRCIEQIYIYYSNDNQSDLSWISHFPKIKNHWAEYNQLLSEVYQDIQLILSQSSLWPNEEFIDRCYTQTLIKPSDWPSISFDVINVEKYSVSKKQICIVVLHCGNHALFHADSQRFPLAQFSDVVKCIKHLQIIDLRTVFFIVSGEVKTIMHDIKKITILKEMYAIYLFVPFVEQKELDQTLCNYKNIHRIFDNFEFLFTCLTSDIKFYLEQPLYMPTVSIFDSQNNANDNNKLSLTDKQRKFSAFQLFVNTLREIPTSICRNQNLYDRCFSLANTTLDAENILEILKTQTDKIFDWFIDAPFLSVTMNSFLQEQFPQNLFDIQQVFMMIDQHFAEVSPTTSSSVVYRVQLLCEEDLKMIRENVNEWIAFHTYLLATNDLLTARTIARQAADRGLLVIIFQIEIPSQVLVLELNKNRLLFQFGTIFRIQSIASASDAVWYAQLTYANSDFQPIQEKLQLEVGEQLTWLTLGNYLCAIEHFEEAKHYYSHLLNTLPEGHQALPSINNNMGLIFAASDDDEKAVKYYHTAMKLLDKIPSNINHVSERKSFRPLSQLDEARATIDCSRLYNKMAEVHLRQMNHDKALECYRKALELATDPLSCIQFEQKIKSVLSRS